jgi:Tfp pilus assembly protein PilF
VCGYLLARHLAIGNVGIPQPQFLENPLAHVDWWSRMMTATKIAGKYLTLWLWPAELSADYSYNAIPVSHSLVSLEVLWAIILWSALVGLGFWGWRRDRRITFGIGLTLIAFFPVSNLFLPIGTIMGERLFYLPSVGLCLLTGIGWDYFNEWANLRKSSKFPNKKRPKAESKKGPIPWYRIGSMTLAILTITSLTVRTAERNTDWATELVLFNSVISIVPNNAKAYLFLADGYSIHGQNTQALEAYTKALRIYPELSSTNVLFNNNYGSLLIREGKITEAIQKYEEALNLNPQLSTLQHNLALAYALGNQPQKAKSRFLEAIRLNPRAPKFHVSFSLFLANQGESVAALEQADRAIKMEPQYALAYYARGVALELEGRKQEAIQNYQEALSRDQNLQPAKQKLTSETF